MHSPVEGRRRVHQRGGTLWEDQRGASSVGGREYELGGSGESTLGLPR